MSAKRFPPQRSMRLLVLAGVSALTLAACAVNPGPETTGSIGRTDYSAMTSADKQTTLEAMAAQYKARPKDRMLAIQYSAALRSAQQAQQATAVIEASIAVNGNTPDLAVAYAKALTAEGRFDQALNVIDGAIRPDAPDWNALSVKGAILDQTGRNAEARAVYQQALTVAPNQASLEANLGLSYAMTNELDAAEQHLRRAVQMPGATSQIRQNLALVIGLQGRFDEARRLFAVELAPPQVEANMTYIRALLTQQNRWDIIAKGDG